MDAKKILKWMFGMILVLILFFYVHEVYAVSTYYQKMTGYKNMQWDSDQPAYANYEDGIYGMRQDNTGSADPGASAFICGSVPVSHYYNEVGANMYGMEFSKEELFEQKNERIVYGKIAKIEPVLCEAEKAMMVPGIKLSKDTEQIRRQWEKEIKQKEKELDEKKKPNQKIKYNACLLKIKVIHNLAGDLSENRSYWAMAGMKQKNLAVEPGDCGIFMMFDNPTLVYLKDEPELVPIVGNITGFGMLRLSYLMDRNAKGLDRLKTKEDAIAYWEKHGLLRAVGKTSDYDDREYINLSGKRIETGDKKVCEKTEKLNF